MANYVIQHQLVQGLVNAVTVAPSPPPITSQTAGATTSQYFTQGTTVADTLLGNAGVITRLLALGAIA